MGSKKCGGIDEALLAALLMQCQGFPCSFCLLQLKLQICVFVCRLPTASFRWLLSITVQIACGHDDEDDSSNGYHHHHLVNKRYGL